MSKYEDPNPPADKETTKALRKRIRESDDFVAVLREIAKDYQFRIRNQWSDETGFPVGNILYSPGHIQCLFHLMGQRNFKTVKAFSYAVRFSKPRKYCGMIGSDDTTGIHDYS
jgi:hypothetical protein